GSEDGQPVSREYVFTTCRTPVCHASASNAPASVAASILLALLTRAGGRRTRAGGPAMARYRLHCVGASGNSFKVALFLNCAGLDWEPVGVDFAGGQTRTPGWRVATNDMGEIPVLEVDGRHMSQSGAILTWLADTHGVFGPTSEE